MTKTKVIVIGIDGATWKILNPLIKDGKLPFIKSLKQKSASGTLLSTIPPVTGPAWATFQTGVNPGKHGVFDFFQVRNNPSQPELIDSRHIKAEKIWEYIGKSGLKSLLLAMPISYPLQPIRGVIVSSFMTPIGGRFAYPESIENKLKSMNYKIDILATKKYGEVPQEKLTKQEKSELIKEALNVGQKRLDAFKQIASKQEFDFYFIFFKETDFIQHLFFNNQQTTDYYKGLDDILKNLIGFFKTQLQGDKYIFAISDHGFHPTAKYQFSPYVWLKSLFNINNKPKGWNTTWNIFHRLHKEFKKRGLVLTKTSFVKQARENLVSKARVDDIASFAQNGFLANMRGVYLFESRRTEEVKKMIVSEAKSLEYKGKKIFKFVARNQSVYKGPFIDDAPDVVWIPSEHMTINLSPLSDRLVSQRPTYLQGEHFSDRNGIIMLSGNKINKKTNIKIHIEDLLPTILYLLSVPIPEKIDGKARVELFTKTTKLNKSRVFKVKEKERVNTLIDNQIKIFN